MLLNVSVKRVSVSVHRAHRSLLSSRPARTSLAAFGGTSVPQLQSWLESHGVCTDGYGKGKAKTVGELFEEAERQESILQVVGGKALRVVNVLSLYVLNQRGQVLFEDEQILPDGRSRRRNVALSEKLIGDEDWRHAVDRAVQEELGSILPSDYKVTIYEGSYRLLYDLSDSQSYPNLCTKYTFHRVSAKVTNLPEEPFTTYEPRPGGQLMTKWVWRHLDEIQTDTCSSSLDIK